MGMHFDYEFRGDSLNAKLMILFFLLFITQGEDYTWFPRTLKFVYYITIVAAFCANMIVVSHTTALSVLGAGMALRGPDGSMMTATDGLYEERKAVFKIYAIGLACTVGSVVICVWLILHWESAFICMILTLLTCRRIYQNYQRVTQRFGFDESETVDFRDIMEGPAAIQAVPWRQGEQSWQPHSMKKSRSMPGELLEDVEWQQNSQPLIDKGDIKRRGNASRTAQPNGDSTFITTI